MKRQLSTIMSLSLLLAMAHAQMNIGQQNAKPATPEWKMYEFQKYGKIGASLYTGTVNYSIPVFTYKDKTLNCPLPSPTPQTGSGQTTRVEFSDTGGLCLLEA